MRSLFVVGGVLLFAMLVTASAQAQEANCLACGVGYSGNMYCTDYNGSWPNCQTICQGYYCSCKRDTGARCHRGEDGTYHFVRVREVLYLPADQPFHGFYRVARARMSKQREG